MSLKRTITKKKEFIPIGGGLLRLGETIPIDKFIIKECRKKSPVVLFVPTASKDLAVYSATFRSVYRKLGCRVRVLELFGKKRPLKSHLVKLFMNVDTIYVGGGDYNLLTPTWKKYGIIQLIKKAYKDGAILTGLSAGCAIWYEYLLDIDKDKKYVLKKGLGILGGISIPHYKRKDSLPVKILKTKNLQVVAIEDNCAAVYIDEKLVGYKSVNSGRVFTINPPYTKKKQVAGVSSFGRQSKNTKHNINS